MAGSLAPIKSMRTAMAAHIIIRAVPYWLNARVFHRGTPDVQENAEVTLLHMALFGRDQLIAPRAAKLVSGRYGATRIAAE